MSWGSKMFAKKSPKIMFYKSFYELWMMSVGCSIVRFGEIEGFLEFLVWNIEHGTWNTEHGTLNTEHETSNPKSQNP